MRSSIFAVILIFYVVAAAYAATLTVTQSAVNELQIAMSENSDIASYQITTPGLIEHIDIAGDNKTAVAHRNTALVYGYNSDVIANDSIATVRMRIFGDCAVSLSAVGATAAAQLSEINLVQTAQQIRHTHCKKRDIATTRKTVIAARK